MTKTSLLLALCAVVAAPAWAQPAPKAADADHSAHHPPAASAPAAAPAGAPSAAPTAPVLAADMAEGEVRRVDKAGRKITLRHGEIKSLDMPPMTMVFQVTDAALLDKVAAGDKVRFRADQSGGNYRVIDLQRVP